MFVGNQPTGSGWRKRNREAVGAGSPCPPPIYRPPASHLSAPGNPSVGRISSIRGRIREGCDGADKSAVGTINRPLHCPQQLFHTLSGGLRLVTLQEISGAKAEQVPVEQFPGERQRGQGDQGVVDAPPCAPEAPPPRQDGTDDTPNGQDRRDERLAAGVRRVGARRRVPGRCARYCFDHWRRTRAARSGN